MSAWTTGGWKIAEVPGQVVAPICICGRPRAEHQQVIVPASANVGQEAIIYFGDMVEGDQCLGYSPDWIKWSMGVYGPA